ncbi:immunoglobulin-like domain-containing protein [Falsibacillus pallidus]|uniref:Bacterial Ig-like domain-containing protein n=1 Tax=Falsibacillus pallidus TaxID=493781 RepID=A0A370G8Q2_9BACI|nr:immunoglobulin-like domain-containing protein [Falsibacillus pallidus]RDI40147.1 hypothetical protein DFR59_11263 [Falsibacillus pallidus]
MFKRLSTAIILLLVVLGGCEFQHASVQTVQNKPPGMDLPNQGVPIKHKKLDPPLEFSNKSFVDSLDASFKKSGFGDFAARNYRMVQIMERSEKVKIGAPKHIKDGDTYETSLYHYNNTTKEFELMKKLILDKTKQRSAYLKLLEDENQAYYMKSVLINPEKDVVEESFRRIFVPYKYRNYRIDVDKDVYYPNETVKVRTTNLGTKKMGTGTDEYLEKWTGTKWKHYQYVLYSEMILKIIPPNRSHTNTIPVNKLTPGFYRVINKDGENSFEAAFEVKKAKTRE